MESAASNRPRWNKNSVMVSWIKSYVLILLIPMVMMGIAYMRTGVVMETEANRANSALLRQLQQDLDSQIEHVQRLSEVIAFNSRVRTLLFAQSVPTAEERVTMVHALGDFKSYNTTNPYIDHFYVYFHNGDFVLSESGYYKTEDYYRLLVEPSGGGLTDWRETLNGHYRGQFVRMKEEASPPGDKAGDIWFARSLPIENSNNPSATLMIRLDIGRLQAAMRNIQTFHEGKVYVFGEDRSLIASTEERADLDPDWLGQLQGHYGVFHAEWNGERFAVSYMKSETLNWLYVYTLPTSLFLEKSEYVRNLMLMSLAITLVAGAATAWWLARRNYHPVKLLIELLASKGNKAFAASSNEYAFIEQALVSTLDEHHQIHRTLEQQNEVLRANFLSRLVKGRIERNIPLADTLAAYKIELISDSFAVLLFYIEDFSRLFREQEQDPEKKLSFVHLIIGNIMEELTGREHRGYVVEADEMLVCLVNLKSGTAEARARDDLDRILEEARSFIQHKFHIYFTVSISSVHQGADSIPLAYQEALQAMEYRMLLGAQAVIRYEDIQPAAAAYPYTLDMEQQLINFVKAGDEQRAAAILNEIIDRIRGETSIPADVARCLMFDLISTMMKASSEVLAGRSGLYEENRLAMQKLLQSETAEEMRRQMLAFLNHVCGHVDARKKSHNTRLKEDVLEYIEVHYRDQNLSIPAIAEHFGIHSSYLSRFFKEQVGETLSDYIGKFRIARAKRLLIEETTPIQTVSEHVGFVSISTFIRLFKKYEGVTPGTFRESALKG